MPTARAFPFDSSIEWTFVTPENGVVDDETTAPSGMNDLCYAFTCVCDDEGLAVVVLTIDDDVSADSCDKDATSCPAWDDDAVEVFLDGECARLPDSRADGGVHLRHGGEFALVANGAANSDYSGYPNSFSGPARCSAVPMSTPFGMTFSPRPDAPRASGPRAGRRQAICSHFHGRPWGKRNVPTASAST